MKRPCWIRLAVASNFWLFSVYFLLTWLNWTSQTLDDVVLYAVGANVGLLTGWLFHHRLKQWDSDQSVSSQSRFPGYD